MARQKGKTAVLKKNEALARLQIEYVRLDEIHPNSYNPNRQNEHEFDLLCRSIAEDGFTQPVITADCDQDHECKGVIVDGEHRWRAAHHVGVAPYDMCPPLEQIPMVHVPMAAPQARIATLRHNRARGSEDIELATEVLRDLEALGALEWAADSLDLSDVELQRLLDDIPAPEALARAEFSEAWIPGGNAPPPDKFEPRSTETEIVGATTSGYDAARVAEARLQQAKSEEERAAIRHDRAVFRLNLVFTGDEGYVIRKALGSGPAAKIMAWCLASPEGQQAQAHLEAERAAGGPSAQREAELAAVRDADGAAVP